MECKKKDNSGVLEHDIIIIDDEDDGLDFEVIDRNPKAPHQPLPVNLTPKRLPSCISILDLGEDISPKSMAQPPTAPPMTRRSGFRPQFRTPNYDHGPRKSYPDRQASCAKSPGHSRRQDSLPNRGPSTFTRSVAGTAANPIICENESSSAAATLFPPTTNDAGLSPGTDMRNSNTSRSIDMLEAAPTLQPYSEAEIQDSNLDRELSQTVHDLETVDLDELEDDLADELRILEVQSIRPEDDQSQLKSKPIKCLDLVRRNASVSEPWRSIHSIQYEGLKLKSNKTVEMLDGDFLRISNILGNSETTEIRIRGNRLQRARDLNGLLERKMNEVVLFLEVDLDDPRPHLEQCAIELELSDIKKIRSLRLTNKKFPLDRNLDSRDFQNRDHINLEGGLTCRWKYTCVYATGTDRYNNIPKERRLERLFQDECTSSNALSEAERQFQWRQGTVRGGAYRPKITGGDRVPPAVLEEPAILIDDSKPSSGFAVMHNSSPLNQLPRRSSVLKMVGIRRIGKRKHSSDDESMTSLGSRERRKRPKPNIEVAVASRHFSTTILQKDIEVSGKLQPSPEAEDAHFTDTIDLSQDMRTSISSPINLISSDLSTPPPSGSLRTASVTPSAPIRRLPGQKLTYGDAFCGGGGSTRGALMAGLHIKWGFDFNKHACATWSANFPTARNYLASAHDFVSRVQNSSQRDSFKVDILHLSPPCQYFSPAHTLDGKDDEMNVASLFAVQSVIDVARPRVVTLEQTFGIVHERFRWFFNALVQMFTSHEFSVRWAVIPLQGWGLPQRRLRLIIIAACPGEILPKMPEPTHADNPPKGSTLKQYTSVDSILSTIPPTAPDHDPASVMFPPDRQMHPWDSTKILPRAMTTSGGQNYHPNGARDFTLREYACLQGFPICHVFRGNCIKKQIGNAVPPIVAKVLFESIRRDLNRADGIVEDVEILD